MEIKTQQYPKGGKWVTWHSTNRCPVDGVCFKKSPKKKPFGFCEHYDNEGKSEVCRFGEKTSRCAGCNKEIHTNGPGEGSLCDKCFNALPEGGV